MLSTSRLIVCRAIPKSLAISLAPRPPSQSSATLFLKASVGCCRPITGVSNRHSPKQQPKQQIDSCPRWRRAAGHPHGATCPHSARGTVSSNRLALTSRSRSTASRRLVTFAVPTSGNILSEPSDAENLGTPPFPVVWVCIPLPFLSSLTDGTRKTSRLLPRAIRSSAEGNRCAETVPGDGQSHAAPALPPRASSSRCPVGRIAAADPR